MGSKFKMPDGRRFTPSAPPAGPSYIDCSATPGETPDLLPVVGESVQLHVGDAAQPDVPCTPMMLGVLQTHDDGRVTGIVWTSPLHWTTINGKRAPLPPTLYFAHVAWNPDGSPQTWRHVTEARAHDRPPLYTPNAPMRHASPLAPVTGHAAEPAPSMAGFAPARVSQAERRALKAAKEKPSDG